MLRSPSQSVDGNQRHRDDGEHDGGRQRAHHQRGEQLDGEAPRSGVGVPASEVAYVARHPSEGERQWGAVALSVDEGVDERSGERIVGSSDEGVDKPSAPLGPLTDGDRPARHGADPVGGQCRNRLVHGQTGLGTETQEVDGIGKCATQVCRRPPTGPTRPHPAARRSESTQRKDRNGSDDDRTGDRNGTDAPHQ